MNLKEGYNGDLTSREAGSVGGQMVKKMIESYEKSLYLPAGAIRKGRYKPPLPGHLSSLFPLLFRQ